MKTLETKRMVLRDWQFNDLEDFSEIWMNPNVTIPQGDLPMLNKDDCLPLLEYLITAKNNYALMLKETGKVIGGVGLNEDCDGNPNGRNLGYLVNEAYWNKGFMQEALKEIIANASEITSFLSVAFPVENANLKSQHIIEKLGFKCVKTIRIGASKITGEANGDMRYYMLDLNVGSVFTT